MAAHDDDLLGAEALGGDHAAQADGAVANHRDALARADRGGNRRVVPGAHHVGEREQRGQQRLVGLRREHVEGAVGLRDAEGLGLSAVGVAAVAEEAPVDALGLQAVVAEDACSVGVGERHHDQIAPLHRANLGADVLDDPDRLVAHDACTFSRV